MSSKKSGNLATEDVAPLRYTPMKQMFRQARHSNDLIPVEVLIGDLPARARNWSRTGIGFEAARPIADFFIGKKLEHIKVRCHDSILYEGGLEVRSQLSPEPDRVVYGGSFTSGLLCIDSLEFLSRIHAFFEVMNETVADVDTIETSFSQATIGLQMALTSLKSFCEEEEKAIKVLPYERRIDVEGIVLPAISAHTRKILGHYNVRISSLLDLRGLPITSIYHRIFEKLIYPFFACSDFVRRAYEKPLGYAGDYEMMNQIYRGGYEGVGLFGRVLHHCTANEPSAESVLFRRPYFKGFYEELRYSLPSVDILSIACGPAVEYQEVLAAWSQEELDRTRVTLFDLDREALEHAQTKVLQASIKASKRANVRFLNASVKTFLKSSDESTDRYDLVYSGGLFDYIDQPTAKALVRKFAAMLKPGGKLVIGNFTTANPTKAFCNLLAKWPLIHRTEADLKEWAEGIDGASIKIDYDSNRINAFLVLTRHAAR